MRTLVYNVRIMRTLLEKALFEAGGQAHIARSIGVSRQTVNKWKRCGFPVEVCAPLETATAGIVLRKLTRPKDWRTHWPELAAQEAASEASE